MPGSMFTRQPPADSITMRWLWWISFHTRTSMHGGSSHRHCSGTKCRRQTSALGSRGTCHENDSPVAPSTKSSSWNVAEQLESSESDDNAGMRNW